MSPSSGRKKSRGAATAQQLTKMLKIKDYFPLLLGYQRVHSRKLPRVLEPQSFLHHPLLLRSASPVQVRTHYTSIPFRSASSPAASCLSRADVLLTREPGVWALERAKQNVLENYLLVGVLEELEDVLLLLERLLPHYFTGVLSIYKSPGTCAIGSLGEAHFHTVVFQGRQMVLLGCNI